MTRDKASGSGKTQVIIRPVAAANGPAFIAAARATGFHKEGYSPAYLKIGGRWRDHERWAIVRR